MLFSSVASIALAIAATTTSDSDDAEPKVAIQRPKFAMAHELALSFGVMPLDPFQKGITGSLSYTVHFDRYFAWEVFHATAAHLTSTDLRDQLIDTFAIPEDDFNGPRFMLTTGFELSPIYGKQVFLNDAVVHQSALIGLHAGAIFGDRGGRLSESLSDLRPAIGLGLGYRLFLSKTISLRADVRDFISIRPGVKEREKADLENVLLISASIAFNFWRDDA